MAWEPISNNVAIPVLHLVAARAAALAPLSASPEGRELVAAVLEDLVVNLGGGVSQLMRNDDGAVFIVGGIDESELV